MGGLITLHRLCKAASKLGTPEVILGGLLLRQGLNDGLEGGNLLMLDINLLTVLRQQLTILS